MQKIEKKRNVYLFLHGNKKSDFSCLFYTKEGFFDIDFFMNSTFNEIFYNLEGSIEEECSYKEFDKLSDCRIKKVLDLNKNLKIICDKYLENANLYKSRIKDIFNFMKDTCNFNMDIPWYDNG